MHRHLSKVTIIIMIILQAKPCFIYIYSSVYGFVLRPINIYMLRPTWCVLSANLAVAAPKEMPRTSNENLNEQQVMEIIRAVLLLHKLSLHLIKMRSGQTLDRHWTDAHNLQGDGRVYIPCSMYYILYK